MRVFLTGADGYIGAILAPALIARGHDVVALDTGYYRRGCLYADAALRVRPLTLVTDVRDVDAVDLTGFDAVIHLAELSNDPVGELRPEITAAINYAGSARLAAAARQAGVPRFVYSSSCSVYGGGAGDEFLSETSPVAPQTTYARCKVEVERRLLDLASDDFSPVILRNATAYGASPRMRFDLVVNSLAALARVTGRIAMTSDGTPWRPLVHVRDIAGAMIAAVEAPREAVHAATFNIGRTDQNFRVREIAALVAEAFPGCDVTLGPSSADQRNYRVSCDKAGRGLPGFRCEWDVRRGLTDLRDVYDRVEFTADQFRFPPFTRLDELQFLLRTGQVDEDLRWTPAAGAESAGSRR